YTDHRLAMHANAQRVGDRNDLHDARVEEALHALAHGRLRQADGLRDRCVGAPAVALELFDDLHRHVVEQGVATNLVVDRLCHNESACSGGRGMRILALAAARDRGCPMAQVQNFINGKLVAARDGATTSLVDPCTGSEYGTAARSAAADVDDAVSAADDAFN